MEITVTVNSGEWSSIDKQLADLKTFIVEKHLEALAEKTSSDAERAAEYGRNVDNHACFCERWKSEQPPSE